MSLECEAQIRAKIEALDKRMAEIDAMTKTIVEDDPRWYETHQ